MTTCSVCNTKVTRTLPNGPWTPCACTNGPYLRTGADLNSAQNCGCDVSSAHQCDRHTIDRLERELQDAKNRLSSISALALEGYTATINVFHNRQYLKIRELTKETIS